MSIRKLRAGRVPAVTRSQYVGERGTIFWDELNGGLYRSDGHTPGGFLIPTNVASPTVPGGITPGPGFTVNQFGVLSLNYGPMFDVDSSNIFQLLPGTSDTIGGIKAGPGVLITSEGELIVDTSGLDFSFGDFVATVPGNGAATLSSINADQNIDIASNGTGVINLVGDVHIHRTSTYNPTLPDANGAVFSVHNDGLVRIHTPTPPIGDSVLSVSANTSATVIPLAAGAAGAVYS